MTPNIIIFEVGTQVYLLDLIPQINIVKIADRAAQGVVSFTQLLARVNARVPNVTIPRC